MAMQLGGAGGLWASTWAGPVPSGSWRPSFRPWSRRRRGRAPSPRGTPEASWRGPLALGAAEHGDHLAALARHAQQLPAALAHVGAPADDLLPLLSRGAKHPQIRVLLPLCRVGLRGRTHREEGGRAISRVLFARRSGADGHLSGVAVASHLTRPTRSSSDPGRVSLLTWPCSDWGLPCHACCQARGGLLPHRFTLTLGIKGGLFSVALSVASRRPGVTWQSALWSSDFPRHATPTGMPRPSRPTATRYQSYGLWKGRGKASAPAAAAAGPGCRATRASRGQAPRRRRARNRRDRKSVV